MRLDGRTCQRTLAFVNRIRAEQGRVRLERLPKGIPLKGTKCPIARATGRETSYALDAELKLHLTPRYVQDFVYAFDNGRIPELIA